jgi:hypothetical protein
VKNHTVLPLLDLNISQSTVTVEESAVSRIEKNISMKISKVVHTTAGSRSRLGTLPVSTSLQAPCHSANTDTHTAACQQLINTTVHLLTQIEQCAQEAALSTLLRTSTRKNSYSSSVLPIKHNKTIESNQHGYLEAEESSLGGGASQAARRSRQGGINRSLEASSTKTSPANQVKPSHN